MVVSFQQSKLVNRLHTKAQYNFLFRPYNLRIICKVFLWRRRGEDDPIDLFTWHSA